METTRSILQAVAYFDMFRYPVTAGEIRLFLGRPVTSLDMEMTLEELKAGQYLFQFDDYYTLQNEPALAARRKRGNEKAENLLQIAYRIGRSLDKFPFVRGVAISGSLSKNYADENADIDFFIITSRNRLWIARSLLHCLKKLSSFLANNIGIV